MKRKVLLIIALLGCCPLMACPPITYLGIEQGLSNNAVRVIFQDHEGFMWFGTYDGLNRYDGYGFKVFRNEFADTASLVNNWINAIGEDGRGRLWIGTRQGLDVYDKQTGIFSNLKVKGLVKEIQSAGNGDLLIATESEGLLYFDNRSGILGHVPFVHDGKAEGQYHVNSIRGAYVSIPGQGLCIWDKARNEVRLLNGQIKQVICFEKNGTDVWLGLPGGIALYHPASNTYSFPEDLNKKIASDKITSLLLDEHGDLWIATNGTGIVVYNPVSGMISEGPGLSSNASYCMYEDKQDRKWIGTLRGGVNIVDPNRERFRTIARNPADPHSLVNDFIFSFYESPQEHLWIGTDGGGLSIWDRKANRFTNYTHDPRNARSISDDFLMNIKADKEGNTWISTYFGGINRCRGEDGVFEHYVCDTIQHGTFALYVDHLDNVWAGTLSRGGLYRYNRGQNRFELFDACLKDLFAMTEDREGNLWGGNLTQLIRIDRETRRHFFVKIGQPVRGIVEDDKGNLWLGTEGGGLVEYDKRQNRILARYTTRDGLCNNAVLNVLADKAGDLWMSTFNGVSKFNISGRRFDNFYYSDGLQSNQFNYNAGIALRSGEFAFGGIKGLTLFSPEKITPMGNVSPLVLTGLFVNNKEQGAGDVTVPYDQALLSFEFTALEYTAPDKISYAYYMEGWDKGWNYPGNTRKAVYTHLEEGTYHFRVRCTNTEGLWNGKELSFRVVVLPPWYRTWWAYLVYVALLASGVYAYIVFRSRQVRLEKERALHEKQLSFFTHISHEFRTPLTLIINPIKEMLDKNDGLKVVYRNARRLISLVDQLLLYQKTESGTDTLRPEALDFAHLCKEVYMCFVQQAKAKKIDYVLEGAEDELVLWADRDKVEIILYNLFSNALKYTPVGGRVVCRISAFPDHIECSLADTGKGIPAHVGGKIFERFYRAEGAAPGFGIGLYLVKQFCTAHGGDITYVSEPGKGTEFTLRLLKGPVQPVSTIETRGFLEEISGDIREEEGAYEPEVQDLDADNLISEKKSILIIDDDPQMIQYLGGMFRQAFKIRSASSGEQGLALARQYLPDVVISDVKMGGLDGIELCRTIKSDPVIGHIPVILLTASTSPESKLKGVEGGADDYMTKPFDNDLLMARVEGLLKSRNVLQRYFYNEITLQQNDLKISGEYKAFIEKCIEVVEAHLEEEDFGVQSFIREMGMSRSSLFRKVKSVSGLSIILFIRFIRLRKAAELFINKNYNVNETAAMVGIYDLKYFRKQFHKLFGLNPSEYIARYRKVFNEKYAVDKDLFDH